MKRHLDEDGSVAGVRRQPVQHVSSQSLPGIEERVRYYLLFAGSHQPCGDGFEHVVGTFTSEERARQGFLKVRLSTSSPMSWARLDVVDEHQGVRALCWFGSGVTPNQAPVTLAHSRTEMPRQTAALAFGCALIGALAAVAMLWLW